MARRTIYKYTSPRVRPSGVKHAPQVLVTSAKDIFAPIRGVYVRFLPPYDPRLCAVLHRVPAVALKVAVAVLRYKASIALRCETWKTWSFQPRGGRTIVDAELQIRSPRRDAGTRLDARVRFQEARS